MQGPPTTGAVRTPPATRPIATGRIGDAAVEAIAYADLFDWPLDAAEVHRFLPVAAHPSQVDAALDDCVRAGVIHRAGSLYALPGRRESLVAARRAGEAAWRRVWPHAVRTGGVLGALPWIRLVAVSGSLAVGAAEDGADLDLFIVTVDGRLWLARALTILAGRALAARAGKRAGWVCPNYIVTTSALELPERDLFTAHELAQLVPVHGAETYRALLAANDWYRDFLPNHPGYTRSIGEGRRRHVLRAFEPVPVSWLERWERERKIARLGGHISTEVRFDESMCKGHFGEHRRRTLAALRTRACAEGLAR